MKPDIPFSVEFGRELMQWETTDFCRLCFFLLRRGRICQKNSAHRHLWPPRRQKALTFYWFPFCIPLQFQLLSLRPSRNNTIEGNPESKLHIFFHEFYSFCQYLEVTLLLWLAKRPNLLNLWLLPQWWYYCTCGSDTCAKLIKESVAILFSSCKE